MEGRPVDFRAVVGEEVGAGKLPTAAYEMRNVIFTAKLEPALKEAASGSRWQFERVGYFYADPIDSKPDAPVLNRTVTLKDGWVKK